MGAIAPQTFKAFETWISPEGEPWFHIHSWQGDAWIRTAESQKITPYQTRGEWNMEDQWRIAEYNSEWKDLFHDIGLRLRDSLGNVAVRIDHVDPHQLLVWMLNRSLIFKSLLLNLMTILVINLKLKKLALF